MANEMLGRPGSVAVSAVYLLLSFSLLTAYIAKVRHLSFLPEHADFYCNLSFPLPHYSATVLLIYYLRGRYHWPVIPLFRYSALE